MRAMAGQRLKILAWKPRPGPQAADIRPLVRGEPLDLESFFTVLDDDDVILLDGTTDPRAPERVATDFQVNVVLATGSLTDVDTILGTASRLKQSPFPPLVFVAGSHAEACPEHFFHPDVDGVFFADALAGIPEVARRIKDGRFFQDVPGGAFPGRNGFFVRNPAEPPSGIPAPRHLLFDAAPERYSWLWLDRCATVRTAVGAGERCRPRPILQVLDEIRGLGAPHVLLPDGDLLSDRGRALEFCDGMRDLGLRRQFVLQGGAEFVAGNPNVMARLKQAGAAALVVDLEPAAGDHAGTPEGRARRQRDDAALAVCRDLDIEVVARFRVDPDWTGDDFRRVLDDRQSRGIGFAVFVTDTVLPGTAEAGSLPVPLRGPWWRHDRLRLHRAPGHLSRMRYYLWLFRLNVLPRLAPATKRRLRDLCGPGGYLRLRWRAWWVGVRFLLKLAWWK